MALDPLNSSNLEQLGTEMKGLIINVIIITKCLTDRHTNMAHVTRTLLHN